MAKSTMVELVIELEKLSESNGKEKMLEMARKGAFHDYKSTQVCGKMYFVDCAQWCKRNMIESDAKIIDRLEKEIKNGVYDETADNEDIEAMAKDIDNNSKNKAEAKALKEMLGLNKKQPPNKWGNNFFSN